MAIITLNNNSLSSVTSLPAAISTGKVLQVVNQEEQTSYVSNSSSAADTGIGLSIVKHAVERNGGVIKLISQFGEGSEFKVIF